MQNRLVTGRTIFMAVVFLALPTVGQAENIVGKERARAESLSTSEGSLKEAEKNLRNIDAKPASDTKEEERKAAMEALERAKVDLEKLSQDLYQLPIKDGLTHMRKMLLYIKRHDDLSGEILSLAGDAGKRVEKEAKEEELAGLKILIEEQAKESDARSKLEKDLDSRFRGFGFGIALGAVIDVGGRDRIESAKLDPNGIVRVEQDSNTRANFMLESHYFFTPDWKFPFGWFPWSIWVQDKLGWVEAKQWGWGPFITVQPGSNNIIESVGIGYMIGFKRTAILKGTEPLPVGDSFNIGVGALLDIKQKVLGDGIHSNQPLPTGETELRFKETSQIGAVVIFSYSFY